MAVREEDTAETETPNQQNAAAACKGPLDDPTHHAAKEEAVMHGSRAPGAVESSLHSYELQPPTLYAPGVQAVYGVEIQGDVDIDPGFEGQAP